MPTDANWRHFKREIFMSVRKHLRFYPEKHLKHQAILKWLEYQRGADTENLIHLMTLGLKVETGEISRSVNLPQPAMDMQDLLPEIRKIVSAAIQNALRNADLQLSQGDQAKIADQETQAFIRNMADNF